MIPRSLAAVTLVSMLACSQPAPPAAKAPIADDTQPRVTLDPRSLIGTWSFDRTCASEDGMTLNPDGTAGTDQGGGMWAIDVEQRLVIIIREQEMGREPDPLAARLVSVITPSQAVGDDLAGRVTPQRAGEPPRDINARRCPS